MSSVGGLISWTDEEIRIRLSSFTRTLTNPLSSPSTQWYADLPVRSGEVRVITYEEILGDLFPLISNYSSIKADIAYGSLQHLVPPQVFGPILTPVLSKDRKRIETTNPSGSFDFYVTNSIAQNQSILQEVTDALNEWKCKIGVNWNILEGGINDIAADESDEISVISLTASGSGLTHHYSNDCDPEVSTQIDIELNPNLPTGEFYRIMLHELGHAYGLAHTWRSSPNDEIDLMEQGAQYFEITEDDLEGAIVIKEHLQNTPACSGNYTVSYEEVEEPIDISLVSVVPSTTPTSNDGAIEIYIPYLFPPYNFQWSNGEITKDISNLAPGTYSVTVTDGRRCGMGVLRDVLITSCKGGLAFPFTIDETHTNASNQNSNNGAIDITVNGISEGNYTYLWSNDTEQVIFSQDEDVDNLGVGLYTVTVTDACGRTTKLRIEITSCDILVNDFVVEPCQGRSNGSIDLIHGAGGPPQLANMYLWSNGETTQNISNLAAGTYTVTITSFPSSGGSCIVVHEVKVDNRPLDFEVTANVIDACLNGVGGSIDLTVTGGTGPFTYEWNTGETTQDISDLSFGGHFVNVSDGEGCSFFDFFSIGIRQIEVEAVLKDQCNIGEKNGSISLTIDDTQGLGPYTFEWSGGETTQNISGLGAGDYTVTITDADGCSDTHSYSLELQNVTPIDLTNPFYAQYATITCSSGSNGSIMFSSFPNFPEYPESIPVWTDSNGNVVGTGSGISGLAPGEYCVAIYPTAGPEGEGEGCAVAEGCFTVDASDLVAGVDWIFNPESCQENGSIWLFASSSNSSITYQWWGPDNELLNNSSSTMSGLSVGDYRIVVSDGTGCTVEVKASICCCEPNWQSDGNSSENWCYNVFSDLPDLEVSLVNLTQIDSDAGITTGAIEITTNQPLVTYYSWTGPNGFLSPDQNINNLEGGTYCVRVSTGCEYVVECWDIVDCETLEWDITDDITDDCPGTNAGIIKVSNVSVNLPSGAHTSPFLFTLRDDNNNFIEDYYQTDAEFEGLNAGNYTLTIEVIINSDDPDQRCETTRAYVLEEREPNINYDVDIEDTCPDYNYGSILITELQSDDPGFAYNWAGGGNGSEIDGLYMGDDYQVTITDGRGCTLVAGPFEVGETSVLTPEEYQEFRPDCLVDYYCNGDLVLEAQEDLIATEGYVEDDCRFYEYWCEVDGQYYYPSGEDGSEREDRGYDEDLDLVNCTLTRTCKDGTPHDVIEGDSSTKHHSGCDGGANLDCCYCFEAYICVIMVDGFVHTEHLDITNHLSVTETPDIGSNPCDPDPEPPATTNCCDLSNPSALNCEVTVRCVEEDGTDSVLQNPVCVADCSVSSFNFICTQQEMEDVVNDFIDLPDTRESAKENVVINTVDKNLSVKVYPNPFQNSLFIEIDSDMNMELNAKIIDVLGRVVKKLDISISKGKSVTNLQDLVIQNAGMFHLILSDNEGKILKTIPIIKQ